MIINMRTTIIYLSVSLCLVMLMSCNSQEQAGEQPDYPVITLTTSSAEVVETYTGSIQGRQDIDIYPQVEGKIERVCVEEGEKVKKGQTLFILDQVPYRASLRTAEANVHAAEAQVATAQLDYESKQELFRENVISEYELSSARNALSVAQAGLEQTKAEAMNARNSFSYTEVKSPSDGIVGTLPYKAGALVSASLAQPLTTVSDNAEMYIYFSMTENQLRQLIRKYGTPEKAIAQMPRIELRLNDGSMYNEKGRIATFSGLINRETGSVSVRSVFPNPDKMLWSGGIGNVIIRRTVDDCIVIPQNVTYELQDKIVVYKVVDNRAIATFITVERLHDGKTYIVTDGLRSGDVIISDGIGQIKDGMKIKIANQAKEEK